MRLILDNPRFRLLWASTAFSEVGEMLYFMVHGWLTLAVTDSPFWVGAAAGFTGVGLLSFSVFGGVLADRLNRRNLLVGGQMLQATMALALAALIFTDQIELWHILTAALLVGFVHAVNAPARMALTLDVAGRDKLLSAMAATFSVGAAMGIVAPLVGGLVVSAFDIGWAYVLIGCAYLVSPAVLLNLRVEPRTKRRVGSPWQDLKQGVHYVFTTRSVRTLILLGLVVEAFGWAHESMLPVMARDVLGVGASGLGYLIAAGAGGAMVTTLIVSGLGDIENKRRLIVLGGVAFGLGLILFAASPWFALSIVLIALAYGGVALYEAILSTLLQTAVPDEMRGRILSFQTITWGVSGLSGFHTGAIAALIGAPLAIAIGGGVVVLNGLRVLIRGFGVQPEEVKEPAGD